jgi:probable rRNA maturation factor
MIHGLAENEAATIVDDERWTRACGDMDAFVAPIAAATVARAPEAQGACAILFTDDATLQRLNRDFRGKDKPTNVLSFPSGDKKYAGDIALSFDSCAAEAAESGKPFQSHATHLLVHGLLHLAGYDHENDADAEIMERLEVAILFDLGIGDPYAE